MRFLFFLFISHCFLFTGYAQGVHYKTAENISYVDDTVSDYAKQQCLLDIHYPTSGDEVPIVLWFHGGGLTSGKKEIPYFLKEKGLVVVGVGYRLSPQVKVDDIICDAARATAYMVKHSAQYRGDNQKIFISGHSAGGYLALMLALNKSYLAQAGVDADKLAGVIPFSAQTITHFTARKEDGIQEQQPVIDSLAPLYWVRKDAPPITLLTGDRELEMLGRYEENAYLKRMLSIVGHKRVSLLEFQGYNHGMVYPGLPVLLREIERLSGN